MGGGQPDEAGLKKLLGDDGQKIIDQLKDVAQKDVALKMRLASSKAYCQLSTFGKALNFK